VPPSTPEDLQDSLDADLAWRRTEMQVIRSDVENIKPIDEDSPRGRSVLRAGVALLYAHWEGFSKNACQAYLDYVSRRRLRASDLSDSFVLLALTRAVRKLESDPTSTESVLDFIRRTTEMRPQIPRQDVVLTESNLRFGVLCKVFRNLGLPLEAFEMRSQLIDRSLCDARNDIAHGKAMFPRRADYLDLHDEVLAMMEAVRDAVLNAVATKAYRAPS